MSLSRDRNYQWVRSTSSPSILPSGRVRFLHNAFEVATNITMERIVFSASIRAAVLEGGDKPALPLTPLLIGALILSTGSALPDFDINTVPQGDWQWTDQVWPRVQHLSVGNTEADNTTDIGWHLRFDTRTRLTFGPPADTSLCVITDPIPAFVGGTRPYSLHGYGSVLWSFAG